MRPIAAATAAAFVLAALLLPATPARALDSRHLRADGVDYRVVTVDLPSDRLELHWRDAAGAPLRSIERLDAAGSAAGRTLLFATNAGIYDSDYRPLGLHIEGGRELRPLNTAKASGSAGNFAIQPNGVFYIDHGGAAGVVPTTQWRARPRDARLATQSGPMLVVDGAINGRFDAGSDSLKWRSGVCAKTAHRVLFAVSEGPVSFHAFARLFRDELGCRDALYLDGTLSRIYTRADGYAGAPAMMVKPYAGMFAVFAERVVD
jgi:uncharacterized protein YigE (DUF2233 family)